MAVWHVAFLALAALTGTHAFRRDVAIPHEPSATQWYTCGTDNPHNFQTVEVYVSTQDAIAPHRDAPAHVPWTWSWLIKADNWQFARIHSWRYNIAAMNPGKKRSRAHTRPVQGQTHNIPWQEGRRANQHLSNGTFTVDVPREAFTKTRVQLYLDIAQNHQTLACFYTWID